MARAPMTPPPTTDEEINEIRESLRVWLDKSPYRQFYLPRLTEAMDACFDWALDNGKQSADWVARCRTWIRRDIEWMSSETRKEISDENKKLRAREQQQLELKVKEEAPTGRVISLPSVKI